MKAFAALTIAVLVAIGVGIAVESTSTPSSAAAPVVVESACFGGSVRPTSIVLACADGNSVLRDLKWSSWAADEARAVGVLSQNDCTPYCAAGHFIDYPASVVLSEPVAAGGKSFLTRVTITLPGRSPTGRHHEVAQACWENPPKPSLPRCPADLAKAEAAAGS